MFDYLRKNLFFGNKIIASNLILSVLLNLIMIVGLYLQVAPRVGPVALRYTIYFGIDLIGPWWQVFMFPLIGIVIIILNFVLAYVIFLKVKLLSYFLVLTSSLIQILLTIMSVLVVLLNK